MMKAPIMPVKANNRVLIAMRLVIVILTFTIGCSGERKGEVIEYPNGPIIRFELPPEFSLCNPTNLPDSLSACHNKDNLRSFSILISDRGSDLDSYLASMQPGHVKNTTVNINHVAWTLTQGKRPDFGFILVRHLEDTTIAIIGKGIWSLSEIESLAQRIDWKE